MRRRDALSAATVGIAFALPAAAETLILDVAGQLRTTGAKIEISSDRSASAQP